jgi:RHS repeat-associated protein
LGGGGSSCPVGQPETDIQSLPYGDQLASYPDQYACTYADDSTPLYYTGKERDTESGNDFFGARYYASTTGRFLSPDWSAQEEPVPYAKLDNPQTLNLYAYVLNNPLSAVDPGGHNGMDPGDPLFTWFLKQGQAQNVAASQPPSQDSSPGSAQQQGQQLRDVTPAEGGKILQAAEGMEGTPYKYGGNDGKKGIDCIHMVCAALNDAGVKARANANANDFQKDVNMRPLGPKEQPRTGDIVQWKHQPTGHVGVYDANPPKPGYNIYSATNHGVMHTPASWFSSLGTPTYYRVEVPQ